MIIRSRFNWKKTTVLLCLTALTVLLSVFVSGCEDVPEYEDNRETVKTAIPTETPIATIDPDFYKPKHGGTLSFAATATDNMNPLFTGSEEIKYIMSLVFDRFIVLENDGDLCPGIAVSWRSEDNLKWHFTLRENVRMTDGSLLCATEVLETLELIETRGGIYSSLFEWVERYYADGDYEIVVILHKPDRDFPQKMVFPVLKHGEMLSFDQYVGSGPYKYVKTEENRMYFTVNGDYWGQKPYYDNFVIDLYEREMDKYNSDSDVMFISGKNISSYSVKTGYDTYRYMGRTFTCLLPVLSEYIEEYDYYTGEYLYTTETVTYSEQGRQALYYCINRTKLINNVLLGNGTQYSWPVKNTCLTDFGDSKPYSQNLEKAYALLEELGYYFDNSAKKWYFDKENMHPVIVHLVSLYGNAECTDIVKSLSTDFESAGLEVSMDYCSLENIAQYMKAQSYTFIVLSFETGSISELRELFTENGTLNFNGYFSEETEQLFSLFDMAEEPRDRTEICELLEKKLNSDLPVLGLYATTEAVLVSERVKGEEKGIFGANNPLESFCSCWYASNQSRED